MKRTAVIVEIASPQLWNAPAVVAGEVLFGIAGSFVADVWVFVATVRAVRVSVAKQPAHYY
jgi:hypothetical protein